MSEAADAEREVEEFFNKEILGVEEPVENEPAFPIEAPPEPKPVEEIAVDPEEPEETPAEETPEEPEETPDSEEEAPEQGEVEEPEGPPEEPEYVAWAKKKYGDDYDPEVVLKTAYEQEKMIGRQAEEKRLLQEEQQARELQGMLDALNTPGTLTAEEDAWVDEVVMSNSPGESAIDALQNDRPELYAAVMDRWGTLGEQEARQMRALHSRVVQFYSRPQPTEAQSYAAALGETFVSLGLDIDQHGPLILSKLDELGSRHRFVTAIQSPDPERRADAVAAVMSLIAANQTVVQKARVDDQVSARVKEEQLRQQASGVNQGGPRVDQPKKSPFWEEFDDELSERGWDGNRPSYGKE